MQSGNEPGHDAAALNLRGIRFIDDGKYDRAIQAFDQSLEASPSIPGVLFNRAEAKRLSGDCAGAAADLHEALRLVPGDADYMHALGLVAYDEDNFGSAMEWYDKALAADPANSSAWNDSGVVHFRKGNFAAARAAFEKAVAIEPGSAEAWYNLADTYEELGLKSERAKALEGLRKAGGLPEDRE
jgi:tetratricopeptide (TPR) repeat protein